MAKTVLPRPVPPVLPTPEEKPDRIGVPLDKDGNIAWDNMRAGSKARLRAALGATSPAESAKLSDTLTPLCAMGVSLLGTIAAGICKSRGYANPNVMLFTESESSHGGTLVLAVLNKYGASLKYAEEIMLAAFLIGGIAVKGMQLQKPASVQPFPQRVPSAEPETEHVQ